MEYSDIQRMLPIFKALIRGYCFYRLVTPFMVSTIVSNSMCISEGIDRLAARKKKYLYCVGAVYFWVVMLLYIIPPYTDTYMMYVIGNLLMFFIICIINQRNYRQKLFLVVTFFSLSGLSSAIAEILYDNLYAFAEQTDYMKNHLNMWVALYAGVCIFYLTLEFSFTIMGIRQILKVYRNKRADMENKELIMLSLPSLIGVMAYRIIQNHRMFYIMEGGKDKDLYEILILLFYVACVIAIVVVIVLYQNIKAKQEENRQAELLTVQISNIRRHIERVESLYQNIHSVKHDMTNHLLILERLYEGNKVEEAKAYSNDLKTELAHMTGGIESGNPVTDVILQEFKKESEKQEISFHSEFHYPTDTNINVFDMSVILNNALQNAVENTGREVEKHISIDSYRRNNAYIIEICNSFTGNLQWDIESELPTTSKEKTNGHGYGLSNIRRVAKKYAGDIDIVLKDGMFCLCVMMMIEQNASTSYKSPY